ncbi:MAG: NADH-quinone oxidoreductase subunit NuoH [Chloroflexota bacterium]
MNFWLLLLIVAIIATLPLLTAIPLIWIERKVAARIQDRLGPNRVGPYGLIQPIADAIKLITKEDITPAGTDKFVYNIAPIISVASVVLMWAAIPLGPGLIGADLEIGILYVIAVASFGTLAVMMAAWSSNNKYALLGAFRVVAQLISYEVPLVLALLLPVMFAGSLSLSEIILAQESIWFFLWAPVAALIFFISAQAETGRGPFDLLEAESELVAGFNIEYSGMKFGLFFAGEFVHVLTNGILMTHLFFGGWWGPFITADNGFAWYEIILGIVYMLIKTTIFYFGFLLLRNSLPRVRIDQLMNLNWKFLVPVSIVNIVITSFFLKLAQLGGFGLDILDLYINATFLNLLPITILMLAGNLIVIFGVIGTYGRQIREDRLAAEAAAVGD